MSTSDDPDRADLGHEWDYIGDLNEGRETDLWKVVQGYLGSRDPSQRRSVEFYADLDPDSTGSQELLARRPDRHREFDGASSSVHFWLALRWAGPPPRIFFTSQPATLAVLSRHPPESHPGCLKRLVPVGMQLRANEGGFFDAP
jgi:hypothetical protein